MVKRLVQLQDKAGMLASPGLATAPVLDLMCSHFVLMLAARRRAA